MNQITLHFNTDYRLEIYLDSNNFVSRWCRLLDKEIQKESILQTDTFSFCMTEELAKEQLVTAIHTVNNFLKKDFINLPNDCDWNDQAYYNYLHRQFEQLSGPDWDRPTRLIKLAPPNIKLAIRHINRFCHRLEQRPYRALPYMRVEFDTIERKEFESADYDLFVQDTKALRVYLDFGTLGKSLQECYQDGLDPEYPGAKLQNHYSANFVIGFEDECNDGFKSWLKQHNINMHTKGLGHIPLGYIVDTKARQSIEKCSTISKITLE